MPQLRVFLFSLFGFIFVILFTGIPNYFFMPPQGIHFARQMDSFAFTEYYFLQNWNLFTPGNLNLQSINGRCASEFPIVYYLSAVTYFFFGVNFLSLKFLSLLLLFIGFWFCVKFLFLLCENYWLSILFSILFFSSTVILYYGSLYSPDIHAFSLIFVCFYYFFSFIKSQQKKQLILLYIFITVVVLLKISFYYYEITFLILFWVIYRDKGIKFSNNFYLFIASSLFIFSWYLYVRFYNDINSAWYYTTSIKPFWRYPKVKMVEAINFISGYWYPKYYFQSTFHFFLGGFLAYLLLIRKTKIDLLLICLLILFSCVYISLFLIQFIHHDYYMVAVFPSIILVTSISVIRVLEKFKNKFVDVLIIVFIAILSILSLNYAKLNLYRRYTNNIDSVSIVRYQMFGASDFLDSVNINKDSKFLVIGDKSQNGSLVFLNRFGWTYPDFKLDYGSVESNLPLANYLLILKPSANPIPLELNAKLRLCKKYTYNSNFIYDLKNYVP